MSLDFCLEADRSMSIETFAHAVKRAGARSVDVDASTMDAVFDSGLSVSGEMTTDAEIHAEDSKGCAFPIGLRGYLRIKGPEPEGHSALDDLARVVEEVARRCPAHFLVSFQYERTLYWRNQDGFHRER